MPDPSPIIDPAGDIELGATAGDLRYWLAKEALRQVESQKKSQTDVYASFSNRATSILGWAVTGLSALGAAIVTGNFVFVSLAAAFPLLVAGGLSIYVLWPKKWFDAAWPADWLLQTSLTSELEVLEAMASGGQATMTADSRKLDGSAKAVAVAYACLASAPVVALLTFLGLSLWWPQRVTFHQTQESASASAVASHPR